MFSQGVGGAAAGPGIAAWERRGESKGDMGFAFQGNREKTHPNTVYSSFPEIRGFL